jgi:hypothetical protein
MTMFVHTLTGIIAPPRADEPWTHVRFEGAETADGTIEEIETLELDPVDDDPEHPQARVLTTDDAPFAEGWLRVVFIDAGGQESAASELIQSPAPDSYVWIAAALTLDDLRRYIAGGAAGVSAGAADDEFLTDVLRSAVTFTDGYIGGLPSPIPADLRDAILTLAARRYHERNSGYQDAMVGGDGMVNYFKQLPASVKVILDRYKPQTAQSFLVGW